MIGKRRFATIGLLLVVYALIAQGSASAVHWNNVYPHIFDRNMILLYHSNLTTQFRNAAAYSRTTNWDPTDLVTSLTTNHDISRMQLQSANYSPSTWYGRTVCFGLLPYNHCDHFHNEFNLRYSYTDTEARVLVCHEGGHSLGFDHPTNTPPTSCISNGTWTITTYDVHDKAGITNHF